MNDDRDLIHKAAGGWLREAGKRDRPRLLAFFDRHAATMPRTKLRYAIEPLDPEQRGHYLGLKGAARDATKVPTAMADAENRQGSPVPWAADEPRGR